MMEYEHELPSQGVELREYVKTIPYETLRLYRIDLSDKLSVVKEKLDLVETGDETGAKPVETEGYLGWLRKAKVAKAILSRQYQAVCYELSERHIAQAKIVQESKEERDAAKLAQREEYYKSRQNTFEQFLVGALRAIVTEGQFQVAKEVAKARFDEYKLYGDPGDTAALDYNK